MAHLCVRSLCLILAVVCCFKHANAESISEAEFKQLVNQYCIQCHQADSQELDLESRVTNDVTADNLVWEKVVRKLEARQMPPLGEDRPSDQEYTALSQYLISKLDAAAGERPVTGHVEALRRLNRTEYQNAIRDLFGLQIDASKLLPADESSHGFDHITVSDLSPPLLSRYIQAAQKIARLAAGTPRNRPDGTTYRIKADTTQEQHFPGLPLGTRGGGLFLHTFTQSGEYEVRVRLTRDRNDEVEGLHGTHQLEVLLDDERVASMEVKRPETGNLADFDDSSLRARIHATAGQHELGVTFVRTGASLEETKRQPLNVHFNLHRHPRLSPAIYEVSILGPFIDGPTVRKVDQENPDVIAESVLRTLSRLAYRRLATDADLERLMSFYREGYQQGGDIHGMESAYAAVLTSPNFLLKIERQPRDVQQGAAYFIDQFELASRLSFFLWSSIPDEELLVAAEQGELRDPGVVEQQVRRMLKDARATNLATNFASQWLHLRNLDSITPDGRLYPDFDENLRIAMRRETELHVQEIIEQDESALNLIQSDHTFLNERLAKHYGIPHVYGSRFRRVDLPEDSKRGGLLRHGSVLTVTSYATRTSPVIRGNWVLENLLGAPAPPPPANVPSLEDQEVISEKLTVRQRLNKHREDPSCASCHNLMDPVGFALESFDAVGRWRDKDGDQPVDNSGGLPDGSEFSGVEGLESAILKRPELFVAAMTEKLMTFALGRGVELSDGPAIRNIVAEAKQDNYRISSIILGIVQSTPFQMRTAQ